MSIRKTALILNDLTALTADTPKLSINAVVVLLTCLENDGIEGTELLAKLKHMSKSTIWRSLAYWTDYTEGGKALGKGLLRREEVGVGRAIGITITARGHKLKKEWLKL